MALPNLMQDKVTMDMQKVSMENIIKQSEFMQRLVSLNIDQKKNLTEYRKEFDLFRKSIVRRDDNRKPFSDYVQNIRSTKFTDKDKGGDTGSSFIKAVVDKIVNSRNDSGSQLQQKVAEDTRLVKDYNLRMANALEAIRDNDNEAKKGKERDDLVASLGARFDDSLLKFGGSQESGIFGSMLKALLDLAGIMTRGFARLVVGTAAGAMGALGKGGKGIARLGGVAAGAMLADSLYDATKGGKDDSQSSDSIYDRVMKEISGEQPVIQQKEIIPKLGENLQKKEEKSILDKINDTVGLDNIKMVGDLVSVLGLLTPGGLLKKIAISGAGAIASEGTDVLEKYRKTGQVTLKDLGFDSSKLRLPTMEDIKNPLQNAEKMDKEIAAKENKLKTSMEQAAKQPTDLNKYGNQSELDKKYKEWKGQAVKAISEPTKADKLQVASDIPWLNDILKMQVDMNQDIEEKLRALDSNPVNINNINTNNLVGGGGGGEISLPRVPTSDQDPVVQYFNRAKGIFGF